MGKMSSEFYDDESLTASFSELKKLLKFLENLGVPHPTITGGWAVYAYEGGSGSRDIDIVMVSEADIIQHLYNHYFPAHNFNPKRIGLIPSHYEKIVETPDGPRDIIIDVFNGEKEWKDEVNLGLKFHWGWTLEFQEQKSIDGLDIIIPKRELLIITKMMAAVARTIDYDQTGHYRLPPKISKDCRDVAVLTQGKKIDTKFYEEYIKKSNAEQYIDNFLSICRLGENSKTLDALGYEIKDIESALKIRDLN